MNPRTAVPRKSSCVFVHVKENAFGNVGVRVFKILIPTFSQVSITAIDIEIAIDAQELLSLQGHSAWVDDIAFSPDGRTLATVSEDATARVWDAQTGKELFIINESYALYSLAFRPDGKQLALTSADGKISLWDFNNSATGKQAEEVLTLAHPAVRSVAFDADGKRLASGMMER